MEPEVTKLTDLSLEHLKGLLISIGIVFLTRIERQFSIEAMSMKSNLPAITLAIAEPILQAQFLE